jgi:hypothetical protein
MKTTDRILYLCEEEGKKTFNIKSKLKKFISILLMVIATTSGAYANTTLQDKIPTNTQKVEHLANKDTKIMWTQVKEKTKQLDDLVELYSKKINDLDPGNVNNDKNYWSYKDQFLFKIDHYINGIDKRLTKIRELIDQEPGTAGKDSRLFNDEGYLDAPTILNFVIFRLDQAIERTRETGENMIQEIKTGKIPRGHWSRWDN